MVIFQVKIKKAHYLAIVCLLFVLLSCKKGNNVHTVLSLQELEVKYVKHMDSCIKYLDTLSKVNNQETMLSYYLKARKQFKYVEPILAFVDKDNYKSLNGPNLLKVDEEDATNVKTLKSFGFQVIEEALFEDSLQVENVHSISLKTMNRLELIKTNTSLKLKPYHIVWLCRDQVARIALTGITGFDSPVLEASLQESAMTYKSLKEMVDVYKNEFASEDLYNQITSEFVKSIEELDRSDFNDFNRYSFIKNHTHKQLRQLQDLVDDWNVVFPLELAFKNNMTSLFSSETFNMNFFSDYIEQDDLISPKAYLGEQLFNDVRLSKDNAMSCATCHNKDKAFTDGLKTFPKQLRNTPTLMYSAFQQSFFYDGRSGNLEGQIVDVVNNDNEFHSNLAELQQVVLSDSVYKNQFSKVYKKGVTQENIRNAIAVYIRGFGSFKSKFDNNINQKENTLTKSEINGFNLFTGKAKCATCHFAPIFNGTVPPNFTDTELELLGVPKDSLSSEIDNDLGRYYLFKTENRKHFFKTPTIRNISKTAPYMHNGIYTSLKQVMTFYNNGGGEGLGIHLTYQTLPPDSLELEQYEMDDIINFMNTLEDSIN